MTSSVNPTCMLSPVEEQVESFMLQDQLASSDSIDVPDITVRGAMQGKQTVEGRGSLTPINPADTITLRKSSWSPKLSEVIKSRNELRSHIVCDFLLHKLTLSGKTF
jgi:hypothetical protein